jgi:hypothetical protein
MGALELVAMELKGAGAFVSRALSWSVSDAGVLGHHACVFTRVWGLIAFLGFSRGHCRMNETKAEVLRFMLRFSLDHAAAASSNNSSGLL